MVLKRADDDHKMIPRICDDEMDHRIVCTDIDGATECRHASPSFWSKTIIMSKAFRLVILPLVYLTLAGVTVANGQYNDFRCKCICPSPQVVSNDTAGAEKPDRSVYIGNVNPHECNCDGVVLPQLTSDVQGKAKEFCPRCECIYESRNITTIRWVITLIIGCIICLAIYMAFLILLDPLLHKG